MISTEYVSHNFRQLNGSSSTCSRSRRLDGNVKEIQFTLVSNFEVKVHSVQRQPTFHSIFWALSTVQVRRHSTAMAALPQSIEGRIGWFPMFWNSGSQRFDNRLMHIQIITNRPPKEGLRSVLEQILKPRKRDQLIIRSDRCRVPILYSVDPRRFDET